MPTIDPGPLCRALKLSDPARSIKHEHIDSDCKLSCRPRIANEVQVQARETLRQITTELQHDKDKKPELEKLANLLLCTNRRYRDRPSDVRRTTIEWDLRLDKRRHRAIRDALTLAADAALLEKMRHRMDRGTEGDVFRMNIVHACQAALAQFERRGGNDAAGSMSQIARRPSQQLTNT